MSAASILPDDLPDDRPARVLVRRVLPAIDALSTVTLIVTLFVPWYHGDMSTVRETGGGFVVIFQTGSKDAWSAVPVTAGILLAVSLASLTGVAAWMFMRSQTGLTAAAVGCATGFGVTLWRALDPASLRYQRGLHGHFTVFGSTFPTVRLDLPSAGGETVALIAAAVAAIAVVTIVTANRAAKAAFADASLKAHPELDGQ